jgi:hypothetical protein
VRAAFRKIALAKPFEHSSATSAEVTMKPFRVLLACVVYAVLAGVAGAGLGACSDMNPGGASSTSSGGSSGGGGY